MDSEIDVVYTWADGTDLKFRKEMCACLHDLAASPHSSSFQPGRFRDNGELRYSLRSLEKFAPWVRKVFIVTNGDSPTWLNVSDDRVSVIAHDLIFTRKSDIPTFNTNAIEANLHRIPDLSRRFLYFNDDVFLGRPVSVEDFVTPSGGQYLYVDHVLPTEIPEEFIVDRAQSYMRSLIEEICGRQISRLMPAHVPHLFDREILCRLEQLLSEQFRETSSHKFRSSNDVVLATLYYLYVSEVLGCESGYQYRFLAPRQSFLPFSGLQDYAMAVLTEQTWKMVRGLFAIRAFQPKFFSINDDLGEVSSQHPSFILLRSLLYSYFPKRCPFERSTKSESAKRERFLLG